MKTQIAQNCQVHENVYKKTTLKIPLKKNCMMYKHKVKETQQKYEKRPEHRACSAKGYKTIKVNVTQSNITLTRLMLDAKNTRASLLFSSLVA